MRELVRNTVPPSHRNIYIAVWTLGSCLTAMAGPFGTYASMGFGARLVFWGVVIVSSTLVAQMLRQLSERLVPAGQPWRQDGLMVLLMSLVFTPVVWLTELAVLSPSGRMPPPVLTIMSYVASISLVICVMRRVVRHSLTGALEETAELPTQEAAPDAPGAEPRLMRRLPGSFGGRIIRLNVNDHRVMVVTTEGEYAIRLRFGDAIEEMDPVDGFCTHRSHWVARQAVSGAERERGKIFLRLENGDRVPVSRTYMPDLEEAGLL